MANQLVGNHAITQSRTCRVTDPAPKHLSLSSRKPIKRSSLDSKAKTSSIKVPTFWLFKVAQPATT